MLTEHHLAQQVVFQNTGLHQPRWWTRQRVINGLLRAAHDLYGNDPKRLQMDSHGFSCDTAPSSAYRCGAKRRYPPGNQVLRYFESMAHAWHAAGLLNDEQLEDALRWWTRRRLLAAGAAFYRKHKCLPTNAEWWHTLTAFTAKTPTGLSNQGKDRPYPSFAAIRRIWNGMREYWVAVARAYPDLKIRMDMSDMPWSPLEDWWITETVGLLPRTEVAQVMADSNLGRTEPAIKRRLYDLGVDTYSRWGWTLNHIERVLKVSRDQIMKYIEGGRLPYFRGNKCVYVNPADLPVIQEYNWSKKRHPRELSQAVRRALMERLCFILTGQDWRRFSYHRTKPEHEAYQTRPKKRGIPRLPTSPRPQHILPGHWVRITGEWRFKTPGAHERVGEVKRVYWSFERQRATQKRPAREPGWVAAVEFPKLKPRGRPRYTRVRYQVPIEFLERARKPYERRKKKRKAARPRVVSGGLWRSQKEVRPAVTPTDRARRLPDPARGSRQQAQACSRNKAIRVEHGAKAKAA